MDDLWITFAERGSSTELWRLYYTVQYSNYAGTFLICLVNGTFQTNTVKLVSNIQSEQLSKQASTEHYRKPSSD